MNKEFGQVLRSIRKSRDLTRGNLCEGICTEKQLYRIEKGESEPSLFLLNQLSIKLNIELVQIYHSLSLSKDSACQHEIEMISNYILSDICKLEQYLSDIEKNVSSLPDILTQYVIYGKAICAERLQKDYSLAAQYLLQALSFEHADFSIEQIPHTCYSNCGYACLNLLSLCYSYSGDSAAALQYRIALTESLAHNFLDNGIAGLISSPFVNNLYNVCLSDLADYYFDHDDLPTAKAYIQKSLAFSKLKNMSNMLTNDLKSLSFIAYKEDDLPLAQHYYTAFHTLCDLYEYAAYLKDMDIYVAEHYPGLIPQ